MMTIRLPILVAEQKHDCSSYLSYSRVAVGRPDAIILHTGLTSIYGFTIYSRMVCAPYKFCSDTPPGGVLYAGGSYMLVNTVEYVRSDWPAESPLRFT
jgi:hypothetical protein